MRKHFLLIFPLLLLGHSLAALTLEECLNLAKNNNKELLSAKEDYFQAEQTYNDVKGGLLPQFSLAGNYSMTSTTMPDRLTTSSPTLASQLENTTENEDTIAGYVDGLAAGISPAAHTGVSAANGQIKMEQVLFSGGRLINGIRVARKYMTLQQTKYDLKESDVLYETKDLFYKTLLAARSLDINRQALENARNHYTRVEEMYGQGQVSDYDRLRAELEVAKQEPQVIKASNDYDLAREALAKQIGLNKDSFTLEGDMLLPANDMPTLDNGLSEGLNDRREIIIQGMMTEIYDVNYKVERQNWMPNIGLTADASLYSSADDYGLQGDDFGRQASIGIGFSMPLFTGYSNTAKREKAYHQLRQSQVQRTDTEEAIRLDIRQSYLNLQHSFEEAAAQDKNLRLAERGLTIAEARYTGNVGIQLEVFDAQLQVNSARLQYLNSVYQTIMAREKYNKAIGKA